MPLWVWIIGGFVLVKALANAPVGPAGGQGAATSTNTTPGVKGAASLTPTNTGNGVERDPLWPVDTVGLNPRGLF